MIKPIAIGDHFYLFKNPWVRKSKRLLIRADGFYIFQSCESPYFWNFNLEFFCPLYHRIRFQYLALEKKSEQKNEKGVQEYELEKLMPQEYQILINEIRPYETVSVEPGHPIQEYLLKKWAPGEHEKNYAAQFYNNHYSESSPPNKSGYKRLHDTSPYKDGYDYIRSGMQVFHFNGILPVEGDIITVRNRRSGGGPYVRFSKLLYKLNYYGCKYETVSCMFSRGSFCNDNPPVYEVINTNYSNNS